MMTASTTARPSLSSATPRARRGRPSFLVLAVAALFAAIGAGGSLAAQQDPLAVLRARFDRERQELVEERGAEYGFEDLQKLVIRQAGDLDAFARGSSDPIAATNARLMQVDMLAATGLRDRALAAFEKFDASRADALQILSAARIAGGLRLTERRDELIERGYAAARDTRTPLERRMAAALFLMTALVEIEKAEAIFDAARTAATDDESRAEIEWFRCAAIREREDLPEGSYDEALAELARSFPKTRYGRLAADRVQALEFDVGRPALPLVRIGKGGADVPVEDLKGERVDLSALRGKVVVLDFFAAWDTAGHERLGKLSRIVSEYADRGVVLLGVALDPDRELLTRTLQNQEYAGRVVHAPKAFESDLAVRYLVEQVPRTLILGRDGTIAAIGSFERVEDEPFLREDLDRALAAGGTQGEGGRVERR
jgi:hypothetical protein